MIETMMKFMIRIEREKKKTQSSAYKDGLWERRGRSSDLQRCILIS